MKRFKVWLRHRRWQRIRRAVHYPYCTAVKGGTTCICEINRILDTIPD